MKLEKFLNRIIAAALALSVGANFAITATAEESESGTKTEVTELSFEKTDGQISRESALEKADKAEFSDGAALRYADTDVVRVSIVLKDEPTIAKYSTRNIAANSSAMKYRDTLEAKQDEVVSRIEEEVLGGSKLDVVWKLNLAANIISANVEYGQISKIAALEGIKSVGLETQYDPAVVSVDETDPNMSTSSSMIGTGVAYSDEYTGAGTRIAIIDTGIDKDHQSFDASAFDYAISRDAADKNMSYSDYVASIDLLDAEEINSVLNELNIVKSRGAKVTAEDLYLSSKIAYAYNYVDNNLDIIHVNDTQGEHGSHVSGIAAANRYIKSGDDYFSALKSVHTQGVAPDAQILTMKVFGTEGGAYDSDYMAAIEDALILGADSVNLSLGLSTAGFSMENMYEYQSVLESLEGSDTVVAISAGNEGMWADNDSNIGYLYNDENHFDAVGSPGSYTNSLSVASIDNVGFTGAYISLGDDLIFYTESAFKNKPLASIAGEYSYIAIEGVGTDEDWAALKDVLAGKIAVCSRGQTSFYQKGEAAVNNGAVATLIYNNQPGTISMDLSDYTKEEPCVSLTAEDGLALINAAEEKTTDAGAVYYEGTLTVADSIAVDPGDSSANTANGGYKMSTFSSWGVPESLQLKPEITAPGGNIYSVFGLNQTEKGAITGGSDKYENMSGTSMAAPQIAGMAALVSQYIKENGLDEQEDISVRALAQSLLMSTAVPVVEGDSEYYYSVMKQGAGLANVGKAVSAKSYILMDEAATTGAADGKVKVELGEDADRTGAYSYTFTIKNMSDDAVDYTFDTEFFTQDLFPYQNSVYLDTWTAPLAATVSYSVGGPQTPVTVAPHSSLTVTVNAALGADDKAFLNNYAPNGAWIEGYTFINSALTADGGKQDVDYSIPVLGYYGNLTEASMFDSESYISLFLYGQYDKIPHSIARYLESQSAARAYNSWVVDYYYYIINPYGIEETIPYGREAINPNSAVNWVYTRMIAPARAYMPVVMNQEGKVVWNGELYSDMLGTSYWTRYGAWLEEGVDRGLYYYGGQAPDFEVTPAQLQIPEGDKLTYAVAAIPELYFPDDTDVTAADVIKVIESGKLGDGAFFDMTMTVDGTAPELTALKQIVETDLQTKTVTKQTLQIQGVDANYIAYAALLDKEGNELAGIIPEQTAANQTITFDVDIANVDMEDTVQIFLADYAGNESYYHITEDGSKAVSGSQVVVVKGDDWGPAVEKTIITLDEKIDMTSLNAEDFTVIETKEAFDWATFKPTTAVTERTVLDVYPSDAKGNKTENGKFVTVEMYISPNEGSPFYYELASGFNRWVDQYQLKVKSNVKTVDGEDAVLQVKTDIDFYNKKMWISEEAEKFNQSTFTASDKTPLVYGEFVPEDGGKDKALFIWLHGAGEGTNKGKNDNYIDLLGNEVTAFASDEFQDLFGGAYVVTPQAPTMWMDDGTGAYQSGDKGSVYADALFEFIDTYVKAHADIDPDRVIIGGCSNGGYMTMEMILKHPDYFYKAYPICEAFTDKFITDEQIKALADSHMGIWFTFADTDTTVNPNETSIPTYTRLKAAGANVYKTQWENVHDTTDRFKDANGNPYEYNGHWSWIYFDNNENFDDETGINEWEWLADQIDYQSQIAGKALALEDKVGVNFYVNIPADALKGTYIKASFNGNETVVKASEADSAVVGGKPVRKITVYAAAKELRDDITITVENKSGEKLTLVDQTGKDVTDGFVYTVADYVQAAQASSNKKLVNLVNALDTYGKYAQIYLNYRTDTVKDPADVSGVTIADVEQYQTVISGSAAGIEYKGASLDLSSTISYKVYFTLADDADISSYAFTIDGEKAEAVKSGSLYAVVIPNISAKDLGTMHTVAVANGNETQTVKAGALSYAYTVLSKYGDNANKAALVNMVKSLYLYNQAALDYFAK